MSGHKRKDDLAHRGERGVRIERVPKNRKLSQKLKL